MYKCISYWNIFLKSWLYSWSSRVSLLYRTKTIHQLCFLLFMMRVVHYSTSFFRSRRERTSFFLLQSCHQKKLLRINFVKIFMRMFWNSSIFRNKLNFIFLFRPILKHYIEPNELCLLLSKKFLYKPYSFCFYNKCSVDSFQNWFTIVDLRQLRYLLKNKKRMQFSCLINTSIYIRLGYYNIRTNWMIPKLTYVWHIGQNYLKQVRCRFAIVRITATFIMA